MEPNATGTVAEIYTRVRNGERRAIAAVLSELERGSRQAAEFLAHASGDMRGPPVIGVTGPPGAGKSTLINALVAHWRAQELTVGIIAVDPSSPVSGGAILGDRIRMTTALEDDGVFIRSLASAGHLGGLSPAAVRLIDGFDIAGFDRIVIETVGTGQSEIDVAAIADVRVVVCAPGLGDDIQAMKSGLLEIADVLVVNKADLPGAEQTRQQLAGAVSIRAAQDAIVPVLAAAAVSNAGIPELSDAIAKAAQNELGTPLATRRRRRARYLIGQAASEILRSALTAPGASAADQLADRILSGDLTATAAARELIRMDPSETALPESGTIVGR